MGTRVTNSYPLRCPACGKYCRIAVLPPWNVELGSGWSRCIRCGEEFQDGTKEWPEMTAREKREFFLHDVWLVLAVTALFVCFMLSAMPEWWLITAACGAALLVLTCAINVVRIVASTRRFYKRPLQEQ
jgi:hypothetical protein